MYMYVCMYVCMCVCTEGFEIHSDVASFTLFHVVFFVFIRLFTLSLKELMDQFTELPNIMVSRAYGVYI